MGLPDFPVDDGTLNLLEDSLNGSFTVDADGTHHLVGADFTVSDLLDFLSGYDEAKLETGENGWEEYPDPLYHINDVVRALIAEVRRLRDGLV